MVKKIFRHVLRVCNIICQHMCINSLYCKSSCVRYNKELLSVISIAHTFKLMRGENQMKTVYHHYKAI